MQSFVCWLPTDSLTTDVRRHESLTRPRVHANESATRLIAGCFRFFTLIQSGDRPAR
jgi:hypothetical protein